jgi:hypothetical protein
MNDRTVHRAVRSGAKTVPIDTRGRPKVIRGNIELTPDELSIALEMARGERLEQDLRDYSYQKRATA